MTLHPTFAFRELKDIHIEHIVFKYSILIQLLQNSLRLGGDVNSTN